MNRFLRPNVLCAIAFIPAGTFLLGFIFWNFHDTNPMWGVSSFVLVYDPDMRGATSVWKEGFSRLTHTLLGAAVAVIAIYFLGLHRWLMPATLAIGALICGMFLHFHRSWRVVLVTICLVVGASLVEHWSDFHIALLRAMEVSAGSLLAVAFSLLAAWICSRTGGNVE